MVRTAPMSPSHLLAMQHCRLGSKAWKVKIPFFESKLKPYLPLSGKNKLVTLQNENVWLVS
nr:MAG TPA: hypothetical protein [Caudoviricetes sp.]